MKFYIATSFANKRGHNLLRDTLHSAGHQITYDWTAHEVGALESGDREFCKQISCHEVIGVAEADILIVILPGDRGTHAELGMALGINKTIAIIGTKEDFEINRSSCLFYHHPNVTTFLSPDAFLNHYSIKRVQKGRKGAFEAASVISRQNLEQHPENLSSPSGAKSSSCPRLSLIPLHALERLAARFELGELRYGHNNWRKGLNDKEYVIGRLEHGIRHAQLLCEKIRGDRPLDSDDDAAALMWAGAFACMATEKAQLPPQRAQWGPNAERSWPKCPSCDSIHSSCLWDSGPGAMQCKRCGNTWHLKPNEYVLVEEK